MFSVASVTWDTDCRRNNKNHKYIPQNRNYCLTKYESIIQTEFNSYVMIRTLYLDR